MGSKPSEQQALLPSVSENNTYSTSRSSSYQSITTLNDDYDSDTLQDDKAKRDLFMARFLADFTLGFSDGLTVPFALTAGLSSLGTAQTVIYAGFAELCAGSISMGIGGYLSALDDVRANARCQNIENKRSLEGDKDDVEEARVLRYHAEDDATETGSNLSEDNTNRDASEDMVRHHLNPLNLPPHMVSEILSAIASRQKGLEITALALKPKEKVDRIQSAIWPIMSGISISLGYVIGGLIPLLPYFFTSTVGAGLCWSTGFCLVALFGFGFGKCWMLSEEKSYWRQSLWEGFRMLVLGSLAAVASVLCIKLLETSTGGVP
ncbi:unnamed protein product [Clonostachys solani]|uniref:Uncharacterized protein n=1 Tax=Clonostachys solani TaxID=160281 RepID=A0A9N9ZI01_9HYPO|nr:unnamed protein product [Clonostachys solani]